MKKYIISLVVLLLFGAHPGAYAAESLPIFEGVGGPFRATSSNGKEVGLADFQGKLVLLFFGYANCPDACPLTLAHVHRLMQSLSTEVDHVQVLFVTVDPESDTPEHLREYLARFDRSYIGLSGSRADIDHIVSIFKARYERKLEPQVTTRYNRFESHADDSHIYSHSQQIYLLDRAGRTRGLFYTGTPLTEMREAVKQLIDEPSAGPAPVAYGKA